MKRFHLSAAFLLVLLFGLIVGPVWGQDGGEDTADAEAMKEAFVEEFNRVLIEEQGTRALARNDVLDELAQQISDAIGCNEEPVEFDIQREIIDLGYATFPGDTVARTTRLPLLPAVNIRAIDEMAMLYTADIFENSINQAGRFYREIGIGVTPCNVDDEGATALGSTQQYVLFVILGSQPDVIPVVVGYGGETLEVESVPATVPVSVHQENSRQLDGIYGRTETMRFALAPLTDEVEAVPYETVTEFTFEECGAQTFYYEITDTTGITQTGEIPVEVVYEE